MCAVNGMLMKKVDESLTTLDVFDLEVHLYIAISGYETE